MADEADCAPADAESLFKDALTLAGYVVVAVSDGMQLFQRLGMFEENPVWWPPFDVVITDIRMPGITGTEVLEGVAMMGGRPRVILVSSFADAPARAAAERYGAAALLEKPVPITALLDAVGAALIEAER